MLTLIYERHQAPKQLVERHPLEPVLRALRSFLGPVYDYAVLPVSGAVAEAWLLFGVVQQKLGHLRRAERLLRRSLRLKRRLPPARLLGARSSSQQPEGR